MRAVKAHFDGKSIKLPKEHRPRRPAEVLVIFPDAPADPNETREWSRAQDAAFSKVWDNDEDAVYDAL